MKKLFYPHSYRGTKDTILLLLRVGIAFLLLANHGLPKLETALSGETIQFASVLGMSQAHSLYLAIFTECFCSLLVLLGLLARPASALVVLQMLYLLFKIHWSDALAIKELPLIYLLAFGTILLLGPGKVSLDYVFHKRLDAASKKPVFKTNLGID